MVLEDINYKVIVYSVIQKEKIIEVPKEEVENEIR